jgi:hypothetical protein
MDDLLDVFKLRFQYYFNQEVGDESYIYDLDDCDHLAQHMVIKNKVSKQVICQFRLQLSRDCRDYYLNKFFHYKNFPHGILEVSKLYIHPDQRNNLDLVEVLKKVINIFQNKTRVSSIIYFLDFKMNQKEKILNMEKLLNLPSLKWQNCELKTDFQSHHPNTKSAQDHEIELNSVQDFMVQQSCGIIGEGFVNPEHNCSHLVCLSNPFESKN